MSTQRDVPKLLVEGLVIVASILLAFAIDAWWEEHQDVQAAEELALGLLDDVEASLIDLEETQRSTAVKRDAALMARDLLRSPEPVVSMDSLNALLLTSGAIDITTPVLRSLEQLNSTGLLRKLDPEIRALVATWTQALEAARDYQEQDQLWFRRSVAFPFWARGDVAFDAMLQGYRGMDLGEPRFPRTWRELHQNPELNGILTITAIIAESLLGTYDRVEVSGRELRRVLQAHLVDG